MASAPTPKPSSEGLDATKGLKSVSERRKLSNPPTTASQAAAAQKTAVNYATANVSTDYKAPAGAQAFPAGQTPPTVTANARGEKGGLLDGPHATISAAPTPEPPVIRAATPEPTPAASLQSPEQECREQAPSAYSVPNCIITKEQEAHGLGVGHGGHVEHAEQPDIPGHKPTFPLVDTDTGKTLERDLGEREPVP